MSRLEKIAGLVISNGKTKVAFGQDRATQVARWHKAGSARTDYIDLAEPMDRVAALLVMKAHADFQSPEDQAVIDEAIETKSKAPKGEKRVKAPKAAKPSLESIAKRGKQKVTV